MARHASLLSVVFLFLCARVSAGEMNVVVCKRYKTNLGTYLCKPDGSDTRQLSFLYGEEVSPHLSPDGKQVLFQSSRGGRIGVWTMDLEGKGQKRICDGDQAAWLPDGKGLFFRRDGKIWRRDLASGKEQTVSPEGWAGCSSPGVSPDGKNLLFVAKREGRDSLFVMPLDGKEPKGVATGEIGPAPRWSPDGARIAFQDGAHLYLINKDGSGRTQLTTSGGIQQWPVWMPDGSAVVYCQAAGLRGPWCLCKTALDGQPQRLPTRSAVSILNPDIRAEGSTEAKTVTPLNRIANPQDVLRKWKDAGGPADIVPLGPDGKPIGKPLDVAACGACVEIRPIDGAAKVRVSAPMDLAVIPDRFANDVILDPAASPARMLLPSTPLVLGMMRGGEGMLVALLPDGDQKIEMVKAEGKTFDAVEVSPAGKGFFLGFIRKPGIWHARRIAAPEDVTLDWQPPFPATWRIAASGKVEQESEFSDVKPTKVFDGKKVSIKKDNLSGDALVVVYLYDGAVDTPLDAPVPIDAVRDAMGLAGCERLLDVSGLTGYRIAPRETTWSDIFATLQSIEYLADRELLSQEKTFAAHLCDDAPAFMAGLAERLNEYEAFAVKVKEWIGVFPAGTKDAFAKELDELAGKQKGLPKMDSVPELFGKIKSFSPTDSRETAGEVKKLCKEIRTMVEPRKELIHRYRGLAKQLREAAAAVCLSHAETRDTANKLRSLSQQVLRNRHYFEEDWRGEDYAIVPFWLGRRPWEK